MLAEILNSSSVQQLKGMLRSRYGKGLKVNFMMDVTSVATTAQSPSWVGGDLRLLISSPEGEFLAEAFIEDGVSLSQEDQDSAEALVKLVLESAIQNWKRRNLASAITAVREDNVVSLHSRHSLQRGTVIFEPETSELDFSLRADFKNGDQEFDQQLESLKTKSISTNALFLQSRNPNLFPKVVSEIHELTQRWACLRFSDIKTQVQSVDDLRELGSLTLVIDEILNLSPSEQDLLAQFLVKSNSETEPLLVITSSTSLTELTALSLISEKTAEILKLGLIDVERLPTSTSLLKESLELYLEPEAMI